MLPRFITAAASVYLLRTGPILAVALFNPRLVAWGRVLAGVWLVGIGLCVCSDRILVDIVEAYIYFLGVSLLVVAAIRSGWVTGTSATTRICILSICSGLAIPSLVVPIGPRTLFLVLGWEFVFSCYSYCMDTRHDPDSVNPQSAMWFCLVDPTLVFSQRARPGPKLDPKIQWGLASWWLALLTLAVAVDAQLVEFATNGTRPTGLEYLGRLTAAVAVLFCVKQLSVAGAQVALLRAQGYAIGDRYAKPFRAISPADFWRRWNTYLTAWIKKYWVVPGWHRLRNSGLASRGLAVLAVFLGMGILHDLVVGARDGVLRFPFVAMFGLHGLAFVGWPSARNLRIPIARQVSRVAFWGAFFAIAAAGVHFATGSSNAAYLVGDRHN